MKKNTLLVSILLTSVGVAQAQNCHQASGANSVRECLARYSHTLLTANHPEGVSDLYDRELKSNLEIAGVEEASAKSLDKLVRRIEIPPVRDNVDSSQTPCFDFAKSPKMAKTVEKQMREAAFFLKTYYARSLGNPSSELFNIQKVEICSGTAKSLQFSGQTLRINVGDNPVMVFPTFSAQDLLKNWNDGSVVFGTEQGMTPSLSKILPISPGGQYKQIPKHLWPVLNPIGQIRYDMRMATARKLAELKARKSVQGRSTSQSLNELLSDLKLPKSECNDNEAQNVITQFEKKLNDASFVNQVQEQASLAFNSSKYSVRNVDRRKIKIAIGAINNKQILVDADFANLFGKTYDVASELPKDSNQAELISEHEISLLIGFDGIDQVVVQVRTPKNMPNILQRIAMKDVLGRNSCQVPVAQSAPSAQTGTR
ncbi:MAG: hypothetical protein ACAH59_11815 [Pseudobdellovibrionaceae bacterium]